MLLVYEVSGVYGGAERYLEMLAAGLTERGIDVTALCFGARPEADRQLANRLEPAVAALDFVAGLPRPGPVRDAVFRCRPDVIHWNFPHPWAFRGGLLLLPPWGRPSVVTDHEPMLRNSGVRHQFTRWLANARIAADIVVSQSSADAARIHWRKPPPLHVVRNAVSLQGPLPSISPASGGAIRLLFLGRLEPEKDPVLAVDVLGELVGRGVDATLRVAGTGSLAGAIAARVGERGLGDRVTLAGFVPCALDEMQAADILLSTSRHEGGLPLAAQEALALGLPVVASDIGPNRELAGGSPAVRLAPADPSCWADEVGFLAGRLPAARAEAVARSADLDHGAMVSATIEVYRQVLARWPNG